MLYSPLNPILISKRSITIAQTYHDRLLFSHNYSECRNGTFGVDCSQTCGFCLDREPCNKETGVCEVGCAAGYHGDKCTLGEYCNEYKLFMYKQLTYLRV